MFKLRFSRHAARISVWLGITWMSAALFLHPMSPENFMGMALEAPWTTLSSPQGANLAAWFWLSFAMVLLGIGRLLKHDRKR